MHPPLVFLTGIRLLYLAKLKVCLQRSAQSGATRLESHGSGERMCVIIREDGECRWKQHKVIFMKFANPTDETHRKIVIE